MSLRYLLVCSVFDEKSAINFLSLFLFVMLVVFKYYLYCCCSVAKSRPALCNPHGLQYTWCPSPSPRDYSNSNTQSRWCHPITSSSVAPFSSCPQSFPASRSFPMSRLFASGGQAIGASTSVLPINIPGWFSLALTGMISLLSKEILALKEFLALENLLQHHC